LTDNQEPVFMKINENMKVFENFLAKTF